MIRLIVVVEGQTEEAFIKDVLAPHLAAYSVYVSVTIVGKMTAHRRGHQGRGALVLASLTSLRLLLDAKDDIAGLDGLETNIAGKCPEDINDGLETSPSKRILTYIPGYNKTLHGPLAATGAGLSELRRLCPRFHAWMSCLESLR